MIWEMKILGWSVGVSVVRWNVAHHRQVVCLTTRLPKTGPIFKPARRVKMYIEVPKLFDRPDFHVSLSVC
jgi:hypothetical protein